ncbi:MAG: glycoside hydrolase family 25 protein [Streptomyces sp.]|nr:glycoside hydrolase family 25 protein [Streptomyces sp.]NUS11410.1 glycoside hydrolase family 25 protein [Streptomyces sp.]NUS23449.1 glycoside hydrolase family 25 protein [Streptomyces sp.]
MIHGIDVSAYQTSTPNLSGKDFVVIKATEGTGYVNPKLAAQTTAGRKAGVVVGFYHFARPGNVQAQADYFVKHANPAAGDFLAIDWEDSGVSCTEKDALIKAVKKLRPGLKVVLYCNTYFWLHRDTTSYVGDGLWIADYGHAAGKPPIKSKWLFHQYTDSPVDTDVADFASRAALKTWAAGDVVKHPTETLPTVHLSHLIEARHKDLPAKTGHKTHGAEVELVEEALHHLGFLAKEYVDGSWGTKTDAAFHAFRIHHGYSGRAATGDPGHDSVTLLAKLRGTFKYAT